MFGWMVFWPGSISGRSACCIHSIDRVYVKHHDTGLHWYAFGMVLAGSGGLWLVVRFGWRRMQAGRVSAGECASGSQALIHGPSAVPAKCNVLKKGELRGDVQAGCGRMRKNAKIGQVAVAGMGGGGPSGRATRDMRATKRFLRRRRTWFSIPTTPLLGAGMACGLLMARGGRARGWR